ncbi:MAG: hypothetical protein U1A78_20230 [Polyangia bacterium]
MSLPSLRPGNSPLRRRSGRSLAAALALGLLGGTLSGCGGEGEMMMTTDPAGICPLGRAAFASTYAYFPSDFSVSIVRDTMPQDEACKLMQMYAGRQPPLQGLPVLPYKEEHYSLLITVDSVMPGDDVSVDPEIRGGAGDMRFAVFGQYAIGKNRDPLCYKQARGVIRIQALEQYKRVAGRFTLEFPDGEKIDESFDAAACPKGP